MALAQAAAMSSLTPATSTAPATSQTPLTSGRRTSRQLGLFFGGAAFLGFSMLITRRSLVRRYKATVPAFYQPSNRPAAVVDGAMEALDALTIATASVLSVSMMASGGLLWAFDIASMEEARTKIRGGLGIDASEGRESKAEQEMEEWLATVLQRKDEKDKARGKKGGKGEE